ncbi:general stress protein [Corynebacterium sp. SY003]|nr:general stress protein [Corynebacterium sp. SY003]
MERKRPEGWPVGSFDSYAQAQAAVDMLSDNNFPVEELTIVGVDLMEVEKVTGRLTWAKVIIRGVLSGAWLGVFFAILLGATGANWGNALAIGIGLGIICGVVMVTVPYAMQGGRRDFSSETQIVAGRYDVLCNPQKAREARDRIATFTQETARGFAPARQQSPQEQN